jgi:uncharacterized protein (TIGR02217 family)
MSLAVFPRLDGLEWNINRRSDFKTSIFEALSGKESRFKLRQTPKTTFKLSYEFLIEDNAEQQMTQLLSFMYNRCGSYGAFLYEDENDCSVSNHYCGVSAGSGAPNPFQLTRTQGELTEAVENLNGEPTIYVNGNVQETTVYSITNTGLITFTNPTEGKAISWTGRYYYRCRFLQDGYDFTQLMKDLHECREIEFIGALSNKV